MEKGKPVKVSGASTLFITIAQQFDVIRHETVSNQWRCIVCEYTYSIDNSAHQEIVSFQFHPIRGTGEWLHQINLGPGAGTISDAVMKKHIPSGPISLEAFLKLLLDENEYGIQPRRSNWRSILQRNQQELLEP